MSRALLRRILLGVALAAGLLVGMVAALLWTPPGRLILQWVIGRGSAGEVVLEGLTGRLPDHVHARKVELRDKAGVWLRLRDVSLDWSLWDYLSSHISISQFSARQTVWLRRPIASDTGGTTPPIDIADLTLPQIDVAPAVTGEGARFAAKGALHYRSLHTMSADIAVARIGSTDRYRLAGGITDDIATGRATISESGSGMLGRILGLPGLGPMRLAAAAEGDAKANRISLKLTAGALAVQGAGTVSLAARRLDVDFTGGSGVLDLNPELGWQSLQTHGHVHGSFDRPEIEAALVAGGVKGAGLAAGRLEAQVHGADGKIEASAVATQLHLPGAIGDTFAANPARLRLNLDLTKPDRPIAFSLSHPLFTLTGTTTLAAAPRLSATLVVPDLMPLAAMAGTDLKGQARFNLALTGGAVTIVHAEGRMQTEGSALLARIVGRDGRLTMDAAIAGADINNTHLTLSTPGAVAQLSGSMHGGQMNFHFSAGLPDLARLHPALAGAADLQGSLTGVGAKASWQIEGKVSAATAGYRPEPIAITLAMTGLTPSHADGQGRGSFDGAPANFEFHLAPDGKARRIALSGAWRKAKLAGQVVFTDKPLSGELRLDEPDLADLRDFLGPLSGTLHLVTDLKPGANGGTATIDATLANFSGLGAKTAQTTISGNIDDPFGVGRSNLKIAMTGLTANGVSGDENLLAVGPASALAITADGKFAGPGCAAGTLGLSLLANLPAGQLRLNQAKLDWCRAGAVLKKPATLDFAQGLAIHDLDVAALGGTIAVDGRLAPTLALHFSANGLAAEDAALFVPQISVAGQLGAHGDLTGSLDQPQGRIIFSAKNLRPRVYAFQGGTPIDVEGSADLRGSVASIDATAKAGSQGSLHLTGTAPLSQAGALHLHLDGSTSLELLNPFLAVDGRQAKGQVTIAGDATGSLANPQFGGKVLLRDGEIRDYARGIRITTIAAQLEADGGTLTLTSLSAGAGEGRISGHGSLALNRPQMPVEMTFTLDNARPVASNEIAASLSGNLKLTGTAFGKMTLSGAITIPKAQINLPQAFPPQVATLNVRHRGIPAPQPPPSAHPVLLDLSLTTTGPVIVRGHGIDADVGGTLHILGTSEAPRVSGGFDIRHGTFNIAGQSLDFTRGRIGFDGQGLSGRIDPTLDLVASDTSGGVTATITVTGHVSQPRIVLSSSPDLPQDEVLAHLLFQQSSTKLSPLQIAQGAQALASLSGLSGGFNPISSLRQSLGLDRFAIGTGAEGGTSVEAGKYVSHNVYLGAKTGSNGQAQAQLRIDLSKNLSAEATVSVGTPATVTQGAAGQDTGSSVGLLYQFQY